MSTGEFWNQKFADAAYKYGQQPNVFLAAQAGLIPAGAQVLVPGDGEGRNGVWLAQQGHHVTSVDASSVGLDKTRALAAERGVQVHHRHRVHRIRLGRPLGQIGQHGGHLHLPSSLRTKVMADLARALRPGGVLILEAFHPNQLGLTSGGPKDVDMLYTLQGLRSDLADAGLKGEELVASEGPVTLDEGPFHQGPAQVTRWVWRRQA